GPHTAERAGAPAAEAGRSGGLERHLGAGHRAAVPARTGGLARARDPLDGVPRDGSGLRRGHGQEGLSARTTRLRPRLTPPISSPVIEFGVPSRTKSRDDAYSLLDQR